MTHLLAEGGYQVFTLGSNEKIWLYFAIACAVAAIVVALFLPLVKLIQTVSGGDK